MIIYFSDLGEPAPEVTALRVRGRRLAVACPYCHGQHHHGAGLLAGDGDGMRRAHCHQGWYTVREASLS
jgi:hypothetical protein